MRRHPGFGTHTDPTFHSQPRPVGEVIRRIGVYLFPYKWLALGTILCAVLSLGFGFLYPKLTRILIDKVLAQGQAQWLAPAALGLLGAFLLREVFNSLRIRINNRLEQNVVYDLRCELFRRLQRLPAFWFDQRSSGDLMTRVMEDVNHVERFLVDGVEQGTVALLSIAGALAIMFWTNPRLALAALIPAPLLVIGALWYTLTAHRRYRSQRVAASELNALLLDDLQGIREIKAYGREDFEDQRFAHAAEKVRQTSLRVMRAWAWYGPAMHFIGYFGIGLVLWVGGAEVLAGRLQVGQLVAFMLYAGMFFYEPIGRLHGLNQMLQSARAAAARIFDILDAPVERIDRPRRLPEPVRGHVRYEEVWFQYRPDRVVLRDISFEAQPGQMVALVGPTGAGKTTLVHLLLAFYEPTRGRILIDGQDIREVALDSLRRQIAIVRQEPFLFNGTVRENILYGRPEATEEELIAAAQAANCHEFILRLPEGYNTRVGERGVKLSSGEKQRISIARALLKDAPILILDEATASVDTQTERLIQEALERLMRGRTTFVIAHRLSTILRADQILVLLGGRIVERGTHEELIRQGGLYARLAQIQNTSTIEESFIRLGAVLPKEE